VPFCGIKAENKNYISLSLLPNHCYKEYEQVANIMFEIQNRILLS